MRRREWIRLNVVGELGDSRVVIVQVANIVSITRRFHKKDRSAWRDGRSELTDQGVLRRYRTRLATPQGDYEVLESPVDIMLLIRGWRYDDPKLAALGRIEKEGGPISDEYFELSDPDTSIERVRELVDLVASRTADWCRARADVPGDPSWATKAAGEHVAADDLLV